MLRILLIPLFAFFYFDTSVSGHVLIAFALLVLSGASDVLDGIIARRFHMVSSLGKVLDPIADKLTGATVAVSLSIQNHVLIPVVIIFFFKEAIMLLGSLLLVHVGTRPTEAKWWGKISTASLYALFLYVMLADILRFFARGELLVFALVVSFLMLYSLCRYAQLFLSLRREAESRGEDDTARPLPPKS